MNNSREQVLEFVKRNGPVLPVQISKILGSNILFSSAILSELVTKKEVNLTSAKVGGSPLYYIKGQESKLNMLYDHLPYALKKIYTILKEERVMRDKIIEPWQRVALRELKDFAKPLNVTVNEHTELFWKWYLLSEEEVKHKIDEILNKREEQKRLMEKAETKEEVKEIPKKKKGKGVKKVETYEDVFKFFNDNDVKIIETIKKDKGQFFIVNLQSKLGDLMYFVLYKNKKKINEGDLSLAYHEGRKYNLPVLFLSKGILTRKGEKFLEELKGFLLFKTI